MTPELDGFLRQAPRLLLQQRKEWAEIIVNFETANKYAVLDISGAEVGWVAERGNGFGAVLRRMFLKSHRPLEIEVLSRNGSPLMRLSRAFFLFFSDLSILDVQGEALGSVHRRFGLFRKKYELKDASGQVFARISSPIWRVWTFPVEEVGGLGRRAEVSKKWAGALKEIFTDADRFQIDFISEDWSSEQRAAIFAAAVLIDFDFFENNQVRGGSFNWR